MRTPTEPTEIIPLRPDERFRFGEAAPIIDLSGEGLPTGVPVGAYLASLNTQSSRETQQRALAIALCVFAEGQRLEHVSEEASQHYHRLVWETRWEETSQEWLAAAKLRLESADYKSNTRARVRVAIRGVLKAARDLDLMSGDSYVRALRGWDKHPTEGSLRGRVVKMDEYQAMLDVCDADPVRIRGKRDAAIIAIAWLLGPRAGELVGLTTDDYHRRTLRVVRIKNNTESYLPLEGEAAKRLDAWLKVRGRKPPGPLFCRVGARGDIYLCSERTGVRSLRPLTRRDAIARIIRRRAEQAGLADAVIPHDFRRAAIIRISRAGGIEFAARTAGHKSLSTTLRYRQIDDDELRAVIRKRVEAEREEASE